MTKAWCLANTMFLLLGVVVGIYVSAMLSPAQPPWRMGDSRAPGVEYDVSDSPVIFRYGNGVGTEIYRLRADGSEWYAPGIDQQMLFQIRCVGTSLRCL